MLKHCSVCGAVLRALICVLSLAWDGGKFEQKCEQKSLEWIKLHNNSGRVIVQLQAENYHFRILTLTLTKPERPPST